TATTPEADGSEADGSEPETPGLVATGGVVPWLLSAKSAEALRAQAQRLLTHLESADDTPRAVDIGWSLATTRAALDH
ncbi:hypothetical protein, partial [Streptomyces hygroscopicus]|uniref:CurL C-terminal domain-containing protein n=1 Tax=Streptomyces hygroscopicus TaxID=1912 RepID=UPI00056115C3